MESKRGKLILVTGGARSGKSSFAEKYAAQSGKKVIYIATAARDDAEMQKRIEEHRRHRPKDFLTREECFYPQRILEEEGHGDTFFLLDCLTLLLTNHLLQGGEDVSAEREQSNPERNVERVHVFVRELAEKMCECPADILVVTNEVGMGLVPDNPLGRVFRDVAGRANQHVAAAADEVWFLVCGIARRFK